MKKLWPISALAALLAFAPISNLAAQDDSGLNVRMGVETGLNVEFGNEHSGWTQYPEFWVGNGDAVNRAWFSLSMDRGDYGFQFNPEFWVAHRGGGVTSSARPHNEILLGNTYGWFNLADGMARISVGKLPALWSNYGTQAWSSATAIGASVEVKPIDGLNVGFVLRPTYRNGDAGPVTGSYENRLTYALGNTFFGARFAPAGGPVGVSAGLQLMSQWEARDDFGGTGLRDTGRSWLGSLQRDYLIGFSRGFRADLTNDDNDQLGDWEKQTSTLGVSFWGGVNINVIDDLTLQIGARAYHLDDFAWSGHVWTNQRVRFDLDDALTVGIDMDQVFLTGKLMRKDFSANSNPGDGPMDIILRFVPMVSFDVSDSTTVGLEIPFAMAPGWSSESYNALSLTVSPWVSQSMGRGFSIDAGYDFGWDNQLGLPDNDLWDYGKNSITNSVWLRFNWSL
jgi:hypothetical protein